MENNLYFWIYLFCCIMTTVTCCGNLRKRTLPTRPPPPPPPPGQCGRPSVSLNALLDVKQYIVEKNSSKILKEITENNMIEDESLLNSNTLVIAGVSSKAGQWPWQAALYLYGRFHCGATLIYPNWLVTAAHCIRASASRYTVVLGDLYRGNRDGREQTRSVRRAITHPSYSRSTIDYDIALIQLHNSVNYTAYIQPACLPGQEQTIPVGSACYISGWGKTRHPGSSTNYLQHARLNVISNSHCQRTNGHVKRVTERMVCARNGNGPQSGCHGDSGGPFVCQQGDGSWYLHGAVSWGSSRCDTSHASSAFARITVLRKWIDETIARYR